ncbi:MAG: hypothetical protein HC888_14710 [Candidatus Competibacteraceae bacterium]|nr:hypothetical protein [Candidatus Competibacteraceae bacterium]
MDTAAVQSLLEKFFHSVRGGELQQGIGHLEEALALDFENVDVMALLKCGHFWRDRGLNVRDLRTSFEKAEYLYGQWKVFAGLSTSWALSRIRGFPPSSTSSAGPA